MNQRSHGVRLWGPRSAIAGAIAAAVFLLDQAVKWWLLLAFDLDQRQPVRLTPFLDLVLVWNRGVSYGWFASHSTETRLILIGLSLFAALALWAWACSTRRPLVAVALGLVIGGALGNGLDRVVHGAVADYLLFHLGSWSWYVFNIADSAIVVGVALLLYDSWRDGAREPAGRA